MSRSIAIAVLVAGAVGILHSCRHDDATLGGPDAPCPVRHVDIAGTHDLSRAAPVSTITTIATTSNSAFILAVNNADRDAVLVGVRIRAVEPGVLHFTAGSPADGEGLASVGASAGIDGAGDAVFPGLSIAPGASLDFVIDYEADGDGSTGLEVTGEFR